MRRAAAAGLLLLSAACSSFQAGRPIDQLPLPVPADKRVEVWSHGEKYQLHAVTVDADSVHGVRYWHDPKCDSCRVAIARSAVDSVRTLAYDPNNTGAFTLVMVPVAFVAFVAYVVSTIKD